MRAITIISGGQTGADRAALDFAIEHGIAHGGWCPRGRLAEDGRIPPRYELTETTSRKYAQRTQWNVRDSDATVVFTIAPQVSGGTALTFELARSFGKPTLHISREAIAAGNANNAVAANGSAAAMEAAATEAAASLRQFLNEREIRRLNIAGPRASQEPQIAEFVCRVLQFAFDMGPTR
jgi:predicted Rossmann-fold nucleotide-binding protein